MPKLRDFSLPLAVALSIFLLGRALPESRHKEAHEAETIVNALSKKLHGKLLTLDDTLHKTKEEISATIKELTILKKVDVLLGQLNNRKESRPLCEHDYIVVDFRYKQNILIAARSALPSHYTISVQGKNLIFPSLSIGQFRPGLRPCDQPNRLSVFNRNNYLFRN